LEQINNLTKEQIEGMQSTVLKVDNTIGRKFDVGKNEYGLLPPITLDEVAKVLTYGSRKYDRENWKYVEGGERRYFDAAQRHIWAWKRGELVDSETGLSHLVHGICCLMFLNELPYVKNKI
jgi:isopentenyl diphosphate isomerase/L-lactate dehydrogenase-like FMN-dependent dehydrogenase